MNKLYFIFCFSVLFPFYALCQSDSIHYTVEAQGIVTTKDHVPFWMRSNHYGSIPLPGTSVSFIGRVEKDYDQNADGYFAQPKIFDWGMGFEGRVNEGKTNQFILTEAYLKAHLGIFELKGGRSKETMGLTGDTSLSSGSFAISGNALGIPKIEISIPEYYTLPIFDGLFAIKGNFAHGWVGTVPLRADSLANSATTYYHQKSLYAKFGKADWSWKLYGGFNHQVFWGNEKKINGKDFTLSKLQSYLYVITGKAYGNRGLPRSKIGNHLGSLDLGFEYNFNTIKIILYRQNFYDVGALFHLANLRDGLSGITLINKNESKNKLKLQKVLFEFLATKNQAGEIWSKVTPSGDEDYYNNYIYASGWAYEGLGLGTPFISKQVDVRAGQASVPVDYFINNRVYVWHLGSELSFLNWNYIGKISYSQNYGTFATSLVGRSGASKRHPYPGNNPIFNEANQFSAYIEARKELNRGLSFSYAVSTDRGYLLNDSFGLIIKVSKTW